MFETRYVRDPTVGVMKAGAMSQSWRQLVTAAARSLDEAGVDSPRVDAEWLAAAVAGVSRAALVIAADPATEARRRFWSLVERRRDREPLQHIVGTAVFGYLELRVGPGVFVPRPETELLVEWVLDALRGVPNPVVADLCAGSGAIGLSVAHERRDATVYLIEANNDSIVWLRRNTTVRNATIVDGDATDYSIMAEHEGSCDAVLSNPPYVPTATAVSPEVARDPAGAVFAGPDGMDVIGGLLPRMASLTRPGGVVAIEHDDSHQEVVPALLRSHGFEAVADHDDLAGRPRFATARKPRAATRFASQTGS